MIYHPRDNFQSNKNVFLSLYSSIKFKNSLSTTKLKICEPQAKIYWFLQKVQAKNARFKILNITFKKILFLCLWKILGVTNSIHISFLVVW